MRWVGGVGEIWCGELSMPCPIVGISLAVPECDGPEAVSVLGEAVWESVDGCGEYLVSSFGEFVFDPRRI